jgi:V/A-type H+/Na+-transporting ATPase subunit E
MADIKEGLASIADEILEDVKKESEKIIRDAETKAEEILRDAKTEAESTRSRILTEAKEKSELEQKKMQSLTQIEIRNMQLQVKENYIKDVFDNVIVRLKQFVESDSYPSCLLNLIEEAVKQIDTEKPVVYVNSKDQKLLKNGALDELAKKMKKNLTLADETVKCLGGCVVKTPDGKLSHDNTFEERLHVLKPSLRIKIAKMLFQEEA